MKEKQIYVEGYKKHSMRINNDSLPDCKHLVKGFSCSEAYITKAGVVLRDEKRIEFQDIRIYLSE